MIGEGLFQAQLNTINDLLIELGMKEERQAFPNKQLGAAHFKGMSFRQVYAECVREYAYDFRLTDQSLLLFVKSGTNEHDGCLGYSYIECPVKVMEYREFVATEMGLDLTDESLNDNLNVIGDELRADYEQYVNSLDSKKAVTPIRYDYKASDYKPGRHPASHVHFGFANEIRVGTDRIMKPISFMLFVLRQIYPAQWIALRANAEISTHCRNVREDLDIVDEATL